MTSQSQAGGALKETKARGWELDARGRVKIIEPFSGDPPDDYFVMSTDRQGVVQIQEYKKRKPELAFTGTFSYDGKRASMSVWNDRNGKMATSFIYTYDERGYILKREEKNRAGRVLYTTDCVCDDKGALIEERYLKGEEYLGRNVYTRDSSGRILTEAHYDKNDENSGSYHFTYDGAGRCTSRAWHNAADELMSVFRYTLDDKGNRKRAELVRNDVVEAIQEFEYDAPGNMLSEQWLDADGNVIRTIQHRAK